MYVIAIPSYKRAQILKDKTLKMLKENKINHKIIHVFVASDAEKKEYESVLTKNTYGKIVVGVPGMMKIRNFISNYYDKNKYILNLDDDIERIDYLKTEQKLAPIVELDTFIKRAFRYMKKNNANIWGIYPVNNPFYMNYGISVGLYYIVGCMWGSKNVHKDKLQVSMDDKEDFERSILYYNEDSKVIRFNYVTVKTKYYTEKGGMQETRTDERVKSSAERLVNTYPQLCELNTGKKSGKVEVKFKRPTLPPKNERKQILKGDPLSHLVPSAVVVKTSGKTFKLKKQCNKFLKKKISINMRKFKNGAKKGPKTRKQAIAIAYNQTKKKLPKCTKIFAY